MTIRRPQTPETSDLRRERLRQSLPVSPACRARVRLPRQLVWSGPIDEVRSADHPQPAAQSPPYDSQHAVDRRLDPHLCRPDERSRALCPVKAPMNQQRPPEENRRSKPERLSLALSPSSTQGKLRYH